MLINSSNQFLFNDTIQFSISNLATTINTEMIELKLVEKILAFINIFFIIFGTGGNLFTFGILMRKNVRKHSCVSYRLVLVLKFITKLK